MGELKLEIPPIKIRLPVRPQLASNVKRETKSPARASRDRGLVHFKNAVYSSASAKTKDPDMTINRRRPEVDKTSERRKFVLLIPAGKRVTLPAGDCMRYSVNPNLIGLKNMRIKGPPKPRMNPQTR